MSSLELAFEGFVQVRLATDPDPCDEPRGVSGWTHAVAGEPDLDRVLVLHDDDPRRVARNRGPTVGVSVHSVTADSRPVPGHPLLGARVELLGDPRFEGRNWIVAGDGAEPIDPLHLRIATRSVVLEKRDVLTGPDDTELPLYQVPPERLSRRIPDFQRDAAAQAEVFAALGVTAGPAAWRAQRRRALARDLRVLDPAAVEQVTAMSRRILDLDLDRGGAAVGTVGVRMLYDLALHGPGTIDDADHLVDGIQTVQDWPLTFWVGGWDADALCMFMRGTLTIPID